MAMSKPPPPVNWLDDLSEDWIVPPAGPETSTNTAISRGSKAGTSRLSSKKSPTGTVASPSIRSKGPPIAPSPTSSQLNWPASRLPRPNNAKTPVKRPEGQSLKTVQAARLNQRKENVGPQAANEGNYNSGTHHGAKAPPPQATLNSAAAGTIAHNTAVHRAPVNPPEPGNTPEWRKRLLNDNRAYGDRLDLFSPHALENIFQRPPEGGVVQQPKDALTFLALFDGKGSPQKAPIERSSPGYPMPSSPPPWSNKGLTESAHTSEPADTSAAGNEYFQESENLSEITNHNQPGTASRTPSSQSKSPPVEKKNVSTSFSSSFNTSDASFSEVPIVSTRTGNRTISGLHYRAVSNASAAVSMSKRDTLLKQQKDARESKKRTPLGRSETFSPAYINKREDHLADVSERIDRLSLQRSYSHARISSDLETPSKFGSSGMGMHSGMPESMLAGTPDTVAGRREDQTSPISTTTKELGASHRAKCAEGSIGGVATTTCSSKHRATKPLVPKRATPRHRRQSTIESNKTDTDKKAQPKPNTTHSSSPVFSVAGSTSSARFGAGDLDQHTFELDVASGSPQHHPEVFTSSINSTFSSFVSGNEGASLKSTHLSTSSPNHNKDDHGGSTGATIGPDTTPQRRTESQAETPGSTTSLPSRSPSPNVDPPGTRVPTRYRPSSGQRSEIKGKSTDLSVYASPRPGPVSPGEDSPELEESDYARNSVLESAISISKRSDRRSVDRSGFESPLRKPLAITKASAFALASPSSPAKASLPKRRRTHFSVEQPGSPTRAPIARYVALHGTATVSRESSMSSLVGGQNMANASVKPIAGKKRKDARHVYSYAVKAAEEVLKQRTITQPGRIISPRNKGTGPNPSREVSPSRSKGAGGLNSPIEFSYDDVESSILSATEAFLSSEMGERLVKDLQSGRSNPDPKKVAEAVAHFSMRASKNHPNRLRMGKVRADYNSSERGSVPPSSRGTTRQRRRSVNTQDFLAEAVKIMEFIRHRQSGEGCEMDEILEETEVTGSSELPSIDETNDSYENESSLNQESSVIRSALETYGLHPKVVEHVQRLASGSYYGPNGKKSEACSPKRNESGSRLLASDAEVGIEIWEPPKGKGRSVSPHSSRSNSSNQRRQSSQRSEPSGRFLSTRISTAMSMSSRRSDTCNVATLAPEAVAHLIPPQIGGMVFDESRRIWKYRDGTVERSRVDRTTASFSEEPSGEGCSLDRIPDLSVDESQERVFLKRERDSSGSTARPASGDDDSELGTDAGTVRSAADSKRSARSEAGHRPTSSHSRRSGPSVASSSRAGTDSFLSTGNKRETHQIVHREGSIAEGDSNPTDSSDPAHMEEHVPFAELSQFLLSEMPDFTLNQEDEMDRPLRQVIAPDGQMMVESRYLRSTGALIRALQASNDSYQAWTTLETVSLRNQNLESLYLLKEFCKNLERLDVSGNRLRHVMDVTPAVRALDVSKNLLNSVTHWGSLGHLQFLDVSHNDLESLTGLSSLIHLRELVIDNNRVMSLRGIELLNGLERLSVRGNRIVELDFGSSRLDRLTELDVGENPVRRLSGLGRLPRLTVLAADDGELDGSSWDEVEGNRMAVCRSLKIARLSRNRFTGVEELAAVCPNLRRLYLDGNSLSEEAGMGGFPELETLSVRGQKGPSMESVSAATLSIMTTLPNDAVRICLSRNRIRSLPAHGPMFSIRSMELAFCGIQSLPEDFALRFPNVQSLNLNFNGISDIAPLLGMGRLERLELAGNRISRLRRTVAVLGRLGRLAFLDLRDNPITGGMYPPIATLSGGDGIHLRTIGGHSWTGAPSEEDSQSYPNDCTTILALGANPSEGEFEADLSMSSIPSSLERWCPDPYAADDEYARKFRCGVELPLVEEGGCARCGGEGECQCEGSSAGPMPGPGPDETFVAVLDQHGRLRRVVYRALVAASCGRLSRLDGRVFDRAIVWAEIGRKQKGRAGAADLDAERVWQKLIELGVVKKKAGGGAHSA